MKTKKKINWLLSALVCLLFFHTSCQQELIKDVSMLSPDNTHSGSHDFNCLTDIYMSELIDSLNDSKSNEVRGAMPKNLKWENGTVIKVAFIETNSESNFTSSSEIGIMKSLAIEWTKYCNLTFDFNSSLKDADIRIRLNNRKIYYSYLGTYCRAIVDHTRPTMELDITEIYKEEIKTDILHEFGHALGLIHEHQRPDRPNLTWNMEAIKKDFPNQTEEWIKQNITSTQNFTLFSEDFDYNSIMIYQIKKEWNNEGFETKKGTEISIKDKEFIQSMYPFKVKGSELTAGNSLALGDCLSIDFSNNTYHLIMQLDGNVVCYENLLRESSRAIWSTGTSGSNGVLFSMQKDGNLVLYTITKQPIWATNTSSIGDGAKLSIRKSGNIYLLKKNKKNDKTEINAKTIYLNKKSSSNKLLQGEFLYEGEFLQSSNNKFKLTMQEDGNLVLRDINNKPIWASKKWGNNNSLLVMQDDGNLVTYNESVTATWSTGTSKEGRGVSLILSDNGGIYLYKNGSRVKDIRKVTDDEGGIDPEDL